MTRALPMRGIVLLALVLTAIPLLWPSVPPLTDLPAHMGRYRVMLGDDAGILGQWYRFQWRPIGYLGVDLLVAGLAPLVGLEPAVKAIVVAIPVLTVAGLLWISREAHGRVQPLAVMAAPLAYNFAFQFGFVNYTLAMALALNAFALWLRLGRRGRLRLRAGVFVPLSCAVWTAHLFGWLVLGLLAFAAEVARERGRGRGLPRAIFHAGIACLPLALPFVMFLAWRPEGPRAGSDWAASLRYKPGWIASALRDRWAALDIASIALIAILFYRSARSRRCGHAPELTIAAAGLLALFVAMPFGAAYADARLAPYVVMLALLAVRSDPREARALMLIALAFLGVRTAAATASFAIEARRWDRHLVALDQVPRGSRLVTFVTADCEQPWRRATTTHLASMAIVRRAAFANDQFDLGSTALLNVVAPGVAGFALDPSQVVVPRPCPVSPEFRTLPQALAAVPRDRFDRVWLIGAPPLDPALKRGLTPVWSDGTDFLFRIDRSGL